MAASHVSIRKHFARLKDPRINRRKRHLLIDLVVIAVCAVICGCDSWPKIALFARKRRKWLQSFLELPNGVPSHDTFERVFARLNPEEFQGCFRQWMHALAERLGVKQIAIDGKTLRGSGRASGGLGPLHLVSAWATENHLTLGQVAVADKSNEIPAIPKLLELKGALVTIDAIGCQKEIARRIVSGGGDYVLTVKDNQPHLFEDVQEAFLKALDNDFEGLQHDTYQTKEKGHGRQEARCYHVIYEPEGIRDRDAWAELKGCATASGPSEGRRAWKCATSSAAAGPVPGSMARHCEITGGSRTTYIGNWMSRSARTATAWGGGTLPRTWR
jgi:predicted transposase YbfD/YdcC